MRLCLVRVDLFILIAESGVDVHVVSVSIIALMNGVLYFFCYLLSHTQVNFLLICVRPLPTLLIYCFLICVRFWTRYFLHALYLPFFLLVCAISLYAYIDVSSLCNVTYGRFQCIEEATQLCGMAGCVFLLTSA